MEQNKDAQKLNPHNGHRKRMREKVDKGLDCLHEHEIMELVLSYIFVRTNVNPLAHALIDKYKTVHNVLLAPAQELTEFKGIGANAAIKLSQMLPLYKRIMLSNARPKVFMRNPAQMKEYLRILFSDLKEEHLFAFYLDFKYQLISEETIAMGNRTSADISIARIMQLAFKHSADAVVLAHNHPGTDAVPTHDDDKLTRDIFFSLHACNMHLLDHFIIGENDEYSYYAHGHISAYNDEALRKKTYD